MLVLNGGGSIETDVFVCALCICEFLNAIEILNQLPGVPVNQILCRLD